MRDTPDLCYPPRMQIHILQYDIVWEDKRANHELVRAMVAGVKPEPGAMVALPEMFDTGFSLNLDVTDDAKTRASERFLCGLAREYGIHVYGSLSAREKDGWGRNWAVVTNPHGEVLARYAKLHPFGFGREPERFRGGDELVSCEWRDGDGVLRVGPLICYDLRFPEVFRLCSLRLGVELFVLGANWPDARLSHWRALLIARAIENLAYVVGVNRSGRDPHLGYGGGSIIVSPKGEILAEAGAGQEVISATVDPEAVRSWRKSFGALRDARPGLLGELPG